MHPKYEQAHLLTKDVIAAGIEVHRHLGPGLIESIYEWAMLHELGLRGITAVSQKPVLIRYKDAMREENLRFDILVENCLLVEVKAVEAVLGIHKAIAMSYLKLLDVPLALVINFHEIRVVDGVNRMMLPGASGQP